MSTHDEYVDQVLLCLSNRAFRSTDEVMRNFSRKHPEMDQIELRSVVYSALPEAVFRGLAQKPDGSVISVRLRNNLYKLTAKGAERKANKKESEHA
jgi:hypothetical protein